jgi:hypothetical protein
MCGTSAVTVTEKMCGRGFDVEVRPHRTGCNRSCLSKIMILPRKGKGGFGRPRKRIS